MSGVPIRGLFFWFLGAFIFYKVSFDAAFYKDISIIAALILAVIFTIIIHYNSFFYAMKMGIHLARKNFSQPSIYFFLSAPIFFISSAAICLVSKVIVYGFSKDLNKNLGGEIFFDLASRSYKAETLVFIAISIAPIILHYFIILLSVHLRDRGSANGSA